MFVKIVRKFKAIRIERIGTKKRCKTTFRGSAKILRNTWSSEPAACSIKSFAASESRLANAPRTKESCPSCNFKSSSFVATVWNPGPDFFSTQATISFSTLPPLYSITLPFLKNLIVGNPEMLCVFASFLAMVASTLASLIGEADRALAAFSHSGARVLQWPHLQFVHK